MQLAYAAGALRGRAGILAKSRGVRDGKRQSVDELCECAEAPIYDLEAGSRCVQDEAPKRTRLAPLFGVCQRLAGTQWNAPYQAIFQWHQNASQADMNGLDAALPKLVRQLEVCADLIDALGRNGGTIMDQLRRWRLRFRLMLQRQRSNGEWQDFEALCRAVEQVDSSTSAERLAELKSEVQKKAEELLKQFAGNLPVAKAST